MGKNGLNPPYIILYLLTITISFILRYLLIQYIWLFSKERFNPKLCMIVIKSISRPSELGRELVSLSIADGHGSYDTAKAAADSGRNPWLAD